MPNRLFSAFGVFLLAFVASGCGKSSPTSPGGTGGSGPTPTAFVTIPAGALTYVREAGYIYPGNENGQADYFRVFWDSGGSSFMCTNTAAERSVITWDAATTTATCNKELQLPVGVTIEVTVGDAAKAQAGYPMSANRGRMQYLNGVFLANVVEKPDHWAVAQFKIDPSGRVY